MKALKLALAGLLMLCALTPASAKTIITEDTGGLIVNYIRKYSDMRDTGEKVVIDGTCASSCTLLLGLLRPENFCATPKAKLGFHSAIGVRVEEGKEPVRTHAAEMSVLMFSIYPGKIRSILHKRGWDGYVGAAHPELIWISAKQIVRPCTKAELS